MTRRVGGVYLRENHRMVVGVDKGMIELAMVWGDDIDILYVRSRPASVRRLIEHLSTAVERAEGFRREALTK